MSKTVVGIVTFGNLPFTKLAIEGVQATVKKPYEIFVVVGKPGDIETASYLAEKGIKHVVHDENWGFPYSLNDIYDFTWKDNDNDYLVIMGNDVIPYPKAIDALIETADSREFEWVCASQYDVRDLLKTHPEFRPYFNASCNVTDFSHRCWETFTNWDRPMNVIGPGMSDVHNLALYKRSVFEKVGYIDVNFYPAYFSDNDYCRRSANLGISSCTLTNAMYFHFWSRTIYQETGGSNHEFFRANASFYNIKWGGPFGSERFTVPFNGIEYPLCPGVNLKPETEIFDRGREKDIIKYWMYR